MEFGTRAPKSFEYLEHKSKYKVLEKRLKEQNDLRCELNKDIVDRTVTYIRNKMAIEKKIGELLRIRDKIRHKQEEYIDELGAGGQAFNLEIQTVDEKILSLRIKEAEIDEKEKIDEDLKNILAISEEEDDF